MENYFNKNSSFYIVPEVIENSVIIKYVKEDSENLYFSSDSSELRFHNKERAEFFSNNINGIMYFVSTVVEHNNAILKIKKPAEITILQRRENERIMINENITLSDCNNKKIEAEIKDLSVGGIKISTKEQLKIKSEYKSEMNFDNIKLDFKFVPTRITCEDDILNGTYITSGQIFLNTPKDKIELIQYCYKKQFEQTNRGQQ